MRELDDDTNTLFLLLLTVVRDSWRSYPIGKLIPVDTLIAAPQPGQQCAPGQVDVGGADPVESALEEILFSS